VIDHALPFDPVERVRFRIPIRDGASIAHIHQYGRVRSAQYDGAACEIEVDAPESLCRRLRNYLVPGSIEPVEISVKK